MEEEVHEFIDYQTSSNKNVNPESKIVFKLDRLVLDELTVDPVLSKYCCLVIDEAHERTISIDVILGLIKELLRKRKNFKVIVTSASMDIELFKQYYKAKILKVSGRMFPVKEIFSPYENEKEVTTKIKKVINNELLDYNNRLKPEFEGHVLAFCTSIDEITELCQYYESKLA